MLTFIDTNTLARKKTACGEVSEVLNRELCGAKNVLGTLRWLQPGEEFKTELIDSHQLLYLMEGKGRIAIGNQEYGVSKGSGVYLGPSETAAVKAAYGVQLRLFHLVVARIPA